MALREKNSLFESSSKEPVALTTGPLSFSGAILGRDGKTGLAPDDAPLFLRDASTEEIYAIDVDFP